MSELQLSALESLSSYKNTKSLQEGLILITSSNLNYLPKAASLNTMTFRVRVLLEFGL
jgi:hypothetical protein